MAENNKIKELQAFVNSGAFVLMAKNTQDQIRAELASLLAQETVKIKSKVMDAIKNVIAGIVQDSDIEFSFMVERKNKSILIKEEEGKKTQQEEENSEQNPEGRTMSKSVGFSVLFPDGSMVKRSSAIKTFIQVLEIIGLERIAISEYSRRFAGYKLIGKEERKDVEDARQQKVGDWYIYTLLDNNLKVEILMEISDYFKLNLRIIWDDGTEYDYAQAKLSGTPQNVLKVVFPDGTIFCESQAVMTMAYALHKIGFERISARPNQKKFADFELVSKQQRTEGGKKWQQEIDGWFVYTYMDNQRKAQELNDVSTELNVGLKVYLNDELVPAAKKETVVVPQLIVEEKRPRKPFVANHDNTKYSLNGSEFMKKRRFAWLVVKTYIDQHPGITTAELQKVFLPEFTSKRLGVVRSIMDMPSDMPESEYPARYFMKDDELIELADGDIITVCNQWNPERIENMVRVAELQGWSVNRSIDGMSGDESLSIDEQEERPQSSIINDGAINSAFTVMFVDGISIVGRTTLDTFISSLRKIGLNRIPEVGITFGNINLVSVIEKDKEKQRKVDGVYVYKNLTEGQMRDILQVISDYYFMGLEIEPTSRVIAEVVTPQSFVVVDKKIDPSMLQYGTTISKSVYPELETLYKSLPRDGKHAKIIISLNGTDYSAKLYNKETEDDSNVFQFLWSRDSELAKQLRSLCSESVRLIEEKERLCNITTNEELRKKYKKECNDAIRDVVVISSTEIAGKFEMKVEKK